MQAKTLLASGILLSIIAVPFFYFTDNSSETLPAKPNTSSKNISMSDSGSNQLKKNDDTDYQKLKTEMAQLKFELQALKQQFAQYQFNSISESGEESIETDDSIVTSKQANIEITAAMDEQEEKVLQQQASQHLQHAQALDDSFMAETVDNSWSYQTVDTINQALQAKQLDGTSVIGVQCKSSICRVEVEHQDFGKADEFVMWFPHFVSGTLPEVMIDKQDDEGGFYTTVIFLARKGTDFPEG